MLETVREYAWERLAAAGELSAARRAHAHYFLTLAERADTSLRGADQRPWIFQLEREHDNLRAALRWLINSIRPLGTAQAWQPSRRRGCGSPGRWAISGTCAATTRKADVGWSRYWPAPRRKSDSVARTSALVAAGPLLMVQAEYARSQAVLTEALALAERQQDRGAIAAASTYLGHATVTAGDVAEGTRLLRQALQRWEALGDPHGVGETLFYLGYAADVTGDASLAADHYLAALDHLGEAGNAEHSGFVHSYLGVLEWRRGNESSAVRHLRAVLQTSLSLRDRWLLSFSSQATVALVGSRATPAAWERLLGAADALAQATGGATFGWEHLPGAEHVAGLREQLAREGDRGAAYREGRTLPFAQVAALAMHLLEEARPPTGADVAPHQGVPVGSSNPAENR